MKRGERGAAAVEFALVLPILLLLVFGIVEFSRAYHVQSTLSGAAREGVRVYALTNDFGQAQDAVEDAAATLDLTRLGVVPGPACPAAAGPSAPRTTITANYDFDFITGLLPDRVLSGTGTMRCNG
jgi:Flp pilus assembly protein TadG